MGELAHLLLRSLLGLAHRCIERSRHQVFQHVLVFGQQAGVDGDALDIVLAGQQVIGRIDAVFSSAPGTFEVVDWKTNKKATADPLQLSIYRLAWAELNGVDPADVTGSFYYVRLGQTVRYGAEDLLDRPALEALLSGN